MKSRRSSKSASVLLCLQCKPGPVAIAIARSVRALATRRVASVSPHRYKFRIHYLLRRSSAWGCCGSWFGVGLLGFQVSRAFGRGSELDSGAVAFRSVNFWSRGECGAAGAPRSSVDAVFKFFGVVDCIGRELRFSWSSFFFWRWLFWCSESRRMEVL